jgi:hypothetical protein
MPTGVMSHLRTKRRDERTFIEHWFCAEPGAPPVSVIRPYVEQIGFSGAADMFVPRETFDRVGAFRRHVAEDMDCAIERNRLLLGS